MKSKYVLNKIKRWLAVILAMIMIVSLFPAKGVAAVMTSVKTSIRNPRIVPVNDGSMKSNQKVTWDCVWFGSYPQTEIITSEMRESDEYIGMKESFLEDDDLLVNDNLYQILQKTSGWDNNGDITLDGKKYRRIKKEDATYAESGTSVFYDWPDETTYHYFVYQPIKWRVLFVDGNRALLLTDKVLDEQWYDDGNNGGTVTWEISSIRDWLNNTGTYYNKGKGNGKSFISSAFSEEECSAIQDTTLINEDNSQYHSEGGNDTIDKIFLLSESEVHGPSAVNYGFASNDNVSDEARQSKSSAYAKAMGIHNSYSPFQGNCTWWLRTMGRYAGDGACVAEYGRVDMSAGFGYNYGHYDRGVRPALYLNLSDPGLYTYAGTVCSDGTVNEQTSPEEKVNVFAELTFDDRTKKKSLSWNKDGYTEEEIQLKVQLKGLGLTSLSMKEIHVELDNLKMFKVKDFKKVTNTGSKYEYTWELDRPLTQENESFEITLVKKGLTWWKPNDVNTYSGLINVTVVCADRSGNLYSNSRNNMNQVSIEYWNELKVQKKIDDQKKAEQEAEKNAGQYQKNAVNEFVDLSDKLELDPNVENCIGKNQYEALKMLIYTEISLADISKSYFTSAGLSDQVAELMMERFLGYKNPKFGIAEKTVPIEVVVAGASNKKYQFKFDCEVTLYLLNGVEFGINGRIKTQMWQVTAPNKKISTISCADGIINQGDLSNFSKAVWGVAKSSIQSAYKNVWGNDADKLANKVMEDSIDSIASKAAKYGLEKPVQLVLQAFYEEKLKSKFSSNFFQLLIYPSKMAVVRCPVDVYVYDSTNNLVGSIINDQATMYGDGVALWTEGDDKYIQLFDDTYQMIYKSTGEGTMDLDIYDSTCSDINYRNCAFSLVPLSDGLEYTQTINNKFLTDVDNYKLTSDKGDAISADKEEIMYQDEYPEESSDQADNNNSEENQQGSFSGTEQPANPDQTAGDNQNSNTNQQPEIDQSGDEYDDQDYEKNPDTVRIPKKGARLKSGTATYKVTRSGNKNGTVAFAKVSGNPSKVTIPASIEVGGITYKVTSIAANAFKNRRKLKTAKIGKNVARIGKKAFYGCKKLKRITIKTKKLTKKSVGSKAFSGVNKKVKVRAPGRKLSAYKKILSARGLGKR